MNTNNIVQHIKVVNDIAERGVKLLDEYNRLMINNEEQKQYLLQVNSTGLLSLIKTIKRQ